MLNNIPITRSRRKTITLKIVDGKLQVLAPINATDAQIQKMIETHRNWIEKKLANPTINVNFDLSKDEYVYFLGNKYYLTINTGKPNKIQFYDDMLLLEGKSIASITKNYRQFLVDYLFERVRVQKRRLNEEFALEFRFYKSKWGCCFTGKRLIILNYLLACIEPEAIDGVICHEIAHLKVGNHSKTFYAHLAALNPYYRKNANLLKKYSIH